MSIFSSVGDRLKEERKRLGLTQTDFGVLGGVGVVTQRNYEKNATAADLGYFERIAAAGVNVTYVLTGLKVTAEEQQLLSTYNAASPAVRAAALAALIAGTAPAGVHIENLKGIQTTAPVVLPPGAFSFEKKSKK
ncbi:helix-turn-helix domain-containing protein [Jeongeupia naejangsanensis]|uniref:Helix-turn-helix transcriptional regulator n=1 Tax=Jeongeupia naejangsanensis TaxID=613195 RepID=A0ABS2BH80_9NEIS|nr:helix-turn-helix transcriptional regulator [Jeongeupia naejangsanensis]MBM3114972.1 helix-turn-helix transcriptional regulator [Jeongeupia naejangsanensis]